LLSTEILEVPLGHVAGRTRDPLHFDRIRRFLSRLLNLADEFGAGLLFERLARSVAVEDLLTLRVELGLLLSVESVDLALLAIGPTSAADPGAVGEVALAIASSLLSGPTGPVAGAFSGAAGTRFHIVARFAHRVLCGLESLQLILDVFHLLRIEFDFLELLTGIAQ
jgi:hypothetical protein